VDVTIKRLEPSHETGIYFNRKHPADEERPKIGSVQETPTPADVYKDREDYSAVSGENNEPG
jgi:hypothetical protein